MTATEFKAKCLEVFTRLERREWTRVVITKRGKEVAVVESPNAEDGQRGFYGWQKNTFILPDDLDIDGPIYDPERDGVCNALAGLAAR